jgi:hypothetical protein
MKQYQKVGKTSFCPIESTIAFVLSIIALILFSLLFPVDNILYFLGFFSLLLSALYVQACFSGWMLLGIEYLICCLGTLLLPQNQSTLLFASYPGFIVVPLLSLMWLTLLRLIVFADRIPFFSFLSTLGSGVFFALCGSLGVLPDFVTQISVLFCVAVFALFGVSRFWTKDEKLGAFGATVVGFVVGGGLTYIASCGFIKIPFILFSYVGLEWFLCGMAAIMGSLHLKKKSVVPFFEQAWSQNLNRRKLIYFTSFCFVLLSLLSVILLSSPSFSAYNSLLITTLIVIGMVVRYRSWGKPTPSYRDLFKDLRTGFVVLKQDIVKMPLANNSSKNGRKK